jgi:hypothetical protein
MFHEIPSRPGSFFLERLAQILSMRACPEKRLLTERTDPLPGPVSEAPTTKRRREDIGWPSFNDHFGCYTDISSAD